MINVNSIISHLVNKLFYGVILFGANEKVTKSHTLTANVQNYEYLLFSLKIASFHKVTLRIDASSRLVTFLNLK